jgi:hypothetical protein
MPADLASSLAAEAKADGRSLSQVIVRRLSAVSLRDLGISVISNETITPTKTVAAAEVSALAGSV